MYNNTKTLDKLTENHIGIGHGRLYISNKGNKRVYVQMTALWYVRVKNIGKYVGEYNGIRYWNI